MKTAKIKKTGLLMALLSFFMLAIFLALGLKQARAAGVTVKLSNFQFIDSAHIQGEVNGQTITFYDQNPNDSNYNYSPSDSDVDTLNQMGLCQGNLNNWGVNLKNPNFTASTIKGTVEFGEDNGEGLNNCFSTVPASAYSPSDTITIQNPNSAAAIKYAWDSSGNIEGVTGSPTYTATNNPNNVFINEANNGTCEASGIIVTDSSSSGTLYLLGGVNPRAGNPNPLPASISKYLQNPGTCQLTGGPTKIKIGGTQPPPGAGGGGGAGDTTSSCTDDVSLSWIICPVVNGISKAADGIDGFVESQLNFDVSANLNDSVQKAWTIFRTLTSVIVVIVMLVMVFSQAIGGGPFDAYTVRKMLPKLVAAVILMQISWPLCEYAIRLSNDAGQAIGQLMAAPFGGPSALELGALLQRLSSVGAVAIGVTTFYGGVITAIVAGGALISLGWPILVLAMLMIFITLIVAFATLLVRNALIILLVMAAPLAFIAFVLPGADRYWKMWKDNFIRVLVFFPLVIALIYAGRIFAWVVAGLGSAGPLDLIMLLVAFFGPYFFLPKTFKWAGPGVAAAAGAISGAWPVKKGREAATQGLMATQKRKQQALVDSKYKSLVYDKDGNIVTDGNRRTRALAGLKRGMVRTAGGHPIPTKRSTLVMMDEAGKWKEEEIGLRKGQINNDYKEFQRQLGVQGAKKAIRDKYYSEGKNPLGDRAFFTWAHDTRSFMEMGDKDWRMGGTVKDEEGNPILDENGNPQHRYKEDMFKTQGWIDFMHGNQTAYGDFSARLGASAVPYRLPRGGGPRTGDYLPRSESNPNGGKRFNVMGYRDAVETNDDGTVKMDEDNHPVYVKDADGNRVPNVYYNPDLKKVIQANPTSPQAHHLAELSSDSERFTKLISQSDDPRTVVGQRPEEFESLAKITAELKAKGVEAGGSGFNSPGKISLETFINEQAKAHAGRNVLQPLTLSSGEHIDKMMGEKDYVQTRLIPTRETAEVGEMPLASTSGTGRASQVVTTPPTATRFESTGQSQVVQGPVTQAQHQVGYAPGTVINAAGGGQPVEIKINHNELAQAIGESVREASEFGTHRGMQKALREAGLHQGGQSPTEPEDDDEERNT